jgi:hypothetical protein
MGNIKVMRCLRYQGKLICDGSQSRMMTAVAQTSSDRSERSRFLVWSTKMSKKKMEEEEYKGGRDLEESGRALVRLGFAVLELSWIACGVGGAVAGSSK